MNHAPVPTIQAAATAGILGSGTGITGTYYDNIDFTGPNLTRLDPNVNFDFDACCAGSPDPTIGADTYSARWLGDSNTAKMGV